MNREQMIAWLESRGYLLYWHPDLQTCLTLSDVPIEGEAVAPWGEATDEDLVDLYHEIEGGSK